jgi:hypothetical protein
MYETKSVIIDAFRHLTYVSLTASTREGRKAQLQEYRCAFNLLQDTAPLWDEHFDIKEGSRKARYRMDYLEKNFENLECIILVAEAIARAEDIK